MCMRKTHCPDVSTSVLVWTHIYTHLDIMRITCTCSVMLAGKMKQTKLVNPPDIQSGNVGPTK